MAEWIAAHATNTNVGDVVRVRDNAFSTKLGEAHNGRICEVLEIKGGDFVVTSIDDRDPMLKRTYYSPNILEKRVEE
jgi:hypothetical protein